MGHHFSCWWILGLFLVWDILSEYSHFVKYSPSVNIMIVKFIHVFMFSCSVLLLSSMSCIDILQFFKSTTSWWTLEFFLSFDYNKIIWIYTCKFNCSYLFSFILSKYCSVSWTARSKQSILKEIHPEHSLEGPLLKLKFWYFVHLMWRVDSSERILMLGKIEGRRRAWQRMRWLDGILSSMDMRLSKL